MDDNLGEHDPPSEVEQHLRRAGYDDIKVETVLLTPENYTRQLVQLAQRFLENHQENEDSHHDSNNENGLGKIDCFIDLCDGAWDEHSVGISVMDLLEHKLNVPITGANMQFFEPTRLQMKQVAWACGVLVPNWRFMYNPAELMEFFDEFNDEQSPPPLQFPLLVKHLSSYASVGLIKDSKVWDIEGLPTQCRRMLDDYGRCLVEEFIQGQEFTAWMLKKVSGCSDY